ncbi:ArdC family protein [Novosphingobium kaempferiae]|uniref:ArdC family protein n=1 Tax=Novosphingobium kaempferiae TaxID=2896849 RepID=UPI001E622178|nr:zincin-like metallopeptidase domain-containing protein [Novosphingobium kaempferiae]
MREIPHGGPAAPDAADSETRANRTDRDAGTGPGSGAGAVRGDLYGDVTRRIIADLEGGRIPWVQPWGTGGADGGAPMPGLPRNAATARPYSGINILILWSAVIDNGWAQQGWVTFRQALAAGGNVRKGEKGTTVVYADRFTPEAEKQRARDTGGDARSIAFLKRFTVFNLAQCEGLGHLHREPVALPEREIVPVAEAVIAASGVDFRIGGSKAYYAPGADFVQVPPQHAFHVPVNYYRTCLHELTHATGHASRLARYLTNPFGSKDYAREELVAEMGSAFLCAALGIVPTVRHADYIGAWLHVLREDSRAIFRAASLASKAADWLLARREAQGQAEADAGVDADGGRAGT